MNAVEDAGGQPRLLVFVFWLGTAGFRLFRERAYRDQVLPKYCRLVEIFNPPLFCDPRFDIEASISYYDTSDLKGAAQALLGREEAGLQFSPAAGEIAMYDRSSEPSLWRFLPPESTDTRWFQGLALVTLVILVFFTLGLLVSAFVDAHAARPGKSSRANPSISSQVGTGH